ncbi:MAG: hypothetical protein ACPG5P_06575, partial [Saprospiraceae bacterium]
MSSILKNIILSILLLSVVSSTSHAQIQWEKMYRKLSKKLRKQGSSEYELDEAMVHPGVEVMGIEPSWCVSKHSFDKYHFNAFSTIVVGEYDINPETGKPRSNRSFSGVLFGDHIEESGQEWTLVKRAKKLNSNVNVNVSIVFSGDYGIGKKNREQHYRFFDGTGNRDVRQVLVDSLKYTFDRFEKEYGISPRNSGVFINIPQLPIRDNDQINTVDAYFKFIEFLVSKLDENTLINIKIPYNFFPTKKMSEGQKQKYFDDFTKRFETINERVNLYVLEGYT